MEHDSDISAAGRGSKSGPDAAYDAAPGARDPRDRITVKKYANRRLYNTSTSSYVTLENLAAMVRDGQDFIVQDAKSGEDITRSVLTQIIFDEEAKGRAPMLPTSFLRQLIRLYGDALQGYVPSYLEMTMQAFERNQETFRGQIERSFGGAPGFAQFDAMTRANIEMFRNAMGMFSPFAGAAMEREGAAAADAAANPAAPQADELAELKRQLAEMQRKVDALARS
ncbi:MAG: polyhydroxyalkanoate synthesis repressor PhaR [Rhodobacteraceae bacterium]|nr:polyhydroxyalkanoate synthesis repressor PhaR [Paracoccaceae bacterium]